MLSFIFAFILSACSSHEPVPYDGLLMSERNPDKFTFLSRQNLYHLEQIYNLKTFSYQRNIIFDSRKKDHVYNSQDHAIVLNTAYSDNPQLLLSAWLHEEFHWWAQTNEKELLPALNELKKYYPKSSQTTRKHILITYLEFEALSFYLEEREAKSVLNQKIRKNPKFKWFYMEVLKRTRLLRKIMKDHNLLPEILN